MSTSQDSTHSPERTDALRNKIACSLQPAEPPFHPPERKRTPLGVSRWPADRICSGQRALSPAALTRPSSFRNLRNTVSRILKGRPSHETRLREMLNNGMPNNEQSVSPPLTSRPGRHLWRPPVSGQTGRTIGNPQPYPINTTYKTDVLHLPCHQHSQRPPIPGRRLMAPLPQAPDRAATPGDSSQVQTSTNVQFNAPMSPSQRALSHASGHAVPVSSHRASSKRALRTTAVPSHLRPPSLHGRSPAPSSSVPDMGTMRTDDLLQSFPTPPNRPDTPQLRTSRSAPGKRPSWSLFPGATRENHDAFALRPLPPLRVVKFWPSTERVDGSDDLRFKQDVVQDWLEDTQDGSLAATTSTSNGNAAVVTSDRHQHQPSNENINRQASIRAHASRSAVPCKNASGQAATQHGNVSGALVRSGTSTSTARSQNPAVLTASPTRIIHGPRLCKHKLAKAKARQDATPTLHVARSARFDGSNAPPPAASEPIAQDHAETGPRSRASIASTNLTVLPPAPVGNNPAREGQANQIGATPSSPSAAQTLANAPAGTTFVTNPGGSTFAIDPGDPHHRPTARAATLNTLQSGPGEHDRA